MKHSARKTILIAPLAALILSACSAPGGSDYFPLGKGAKWDYSMTYMVALGGTGQARATSRVTGTIEVNGKTYYRVVTIYQGLPGASQDTVLYRRDDDGIYAIDESDSSRTEYLAMTSKLLPGTTWQIATPNRTLTSRIEGFETVDVRKETFHDCLRVSYKGSVSGHDTEGEDYYAKGVGAVKGSQRGTGFALDYHLSDESD